MLYTIGLLFYLCCALLYYIGATFPNRKSWIRKIFDFIFQSVKKTIILFTIIIISISFILFFYFQQQTEQSIKDNILAQQIQNQKIFYRIACSTHKVRFKFDNGKISRVWLILLIFN